MHLQRRLTATCRRDLQERKFSALVALADKTQGQEKIRLLQQAQATADAMPSPELQHTAGSMLKAASDQEKRLQSEAEFHALRARAEKAQGQEKITLLEQARATAQAVPSPELQRTAEALMKAEEALIKAGETLSKAEQGHEALAQEMRDRKQLMAALAEVGATITQSPDGSMTILLPNAVLFASGMTEPASAAPVPPGPCGAMALAPVAPASGRGAGHCGGRQ
jgi:hypothetical protein